MLFKTQIFCLSLQFQNDSPVQSHLLLQINQTRIPVTDFAPGLVLK